METTVTITPSNCARFDNALHAQFQNRMNQYIAETKATWKQIEAQRKKTDESAEM